MFAFGHPVEEINRGAIFLGAEVTTGISTGLHDRFEASRPFVGDLHEIVVAVGLDAYAHHHLVAHVQRCVFREHLAVAQQFPLHRDTRCRLSHKRQWPFCPCIERAP